MKKAFSFVLALLMTISLCACGNTSTPTTDDTSSPEQSSEPVESVVDKEPVEEETGYTSYQEILDAYTVKLQEATPGLIEEYNAEAAENTEGLEGLATICNEKVSALAEISMEGTQEMANIYLHSGDGTSEEYQEWGAKLQEVYLQEAAKIQEAYMQSAK
jgi:ABC-type Zn uptake system ZnuABC Zn-binding protein ZnuA